MFQHPAADNKDESRDIVVTETSSTSKTIDNLQEAYTTVPPLILLSTAPEILPQNGNLIGSGLSLPNAFQGERGWLENVFENLKKGRYPKVWVRIMGRLPRQFAE